MPLDEQYGYFLLFRPGRFGKNPFLDTLRQAFLSRKLFQRLYLENSWNEKYSVIHISFGSRVHKSVGELIRYGFETAPSSLDMEGILIVNSACLEPNSIREG